MTGPYVGYVSEARRPSPIEGQQHLQNGDADQKSDAAGVHRRCRRRCRRPERADGPAHLVVDSLSRDVVRVHPDDVRASLTERNARSTRTALPARAADRPSDPSARPSRAMHHRWRTPSATAQRHRYSESVLCISTCAAVDVLVTIAGTVITNEKSSLLPCCATRRTGTGLENPSPSPGDRRDGISG